MELRRPRRPTTPAAVPPRRRSEGRHRCPLRQRPLVAVIADPQRPDAGDTLAISRTGVAYTDIEQALDGWQGWAMITGNTVNLAEIRRRVAAAGLD
ncbi:MAG TPA: hypothetical protein VE666_13055 [Mycobacterium sp.]|nr:hypothetical protein [Mycobacterium sp.]